MIETIICVTAIVVMAYINMREREKLYTLLINRPDLSYNPKPANKEKNVTQLPDDVVYSNIENGIIRDEPIIDSVAVDYAANALLKGVYNGSNQNMGQ